MGASAPNGSRREYSASASSGPKLGPCLGVVDQILEDDGFQPKKQLHTARRICDRYDDPEDQQETTNCRRQEE